MSHSDLRPSKRTRVSAATIDASSSESKVTDHSEDAGESGSESGSGSGSESDSGDDQQDMLNALEAYNRSMLGLGSSTTTSSASKVKGKGKARNNDDDSASETQEFDMGVDGLQDIFSGSEDSDEDEESGEFYDEDEEFQGIAASEPLEPEVIPTVVYADTAAHTHEKISKADYKRFMASIHLFNAAGVYSLTRFALQSSKSSKILASDNPALALDSRKRKAQEDGDEEEQSNLSLDKSLHSLLMTSLIPNAHEASRPVEKRNQMSSRLLELANVTGLGEGKSKLAETSHKDHSARMRNAISQARVDRGEKARVQAQAAGSWVKGIGGLGDSGSGGRGQTLAQQKRGEKSMARKDRDRGLAMGIGKFKGGILTLDKGEIARGSSSGSTGRGRGGKSRGGGGRGRGKRRD